MMKGNIVPLRAAPETAHVGMRARVDTISAIFHAIEAGELLAALPECEVAQLQHRTALTLLATAERELALLQSELQVTPPYEE